MRRTSLLFVASLALCPLACSGGSSTPLTERCTAGASEPCACPSGRVGVAICSSEGTFDACVCEAVDAGDDAIAPIDLPDAGKSRPDAPTGCTCDSPPPPVCLDDGSLQVASLPGACTAGSCSYVEQTVACAEGCVDGACAGADPCAGVTCDGPPPPTCTDGSTLETYASAGTCSGGVCSYASSTTECPDGCSGGACLGDPCAGVTCDSPPANECEDASTLAVYASTGTCSGGACSYGVTASACTTTVENATASCSNGECSFTCNAGYVASSNGCTLSAAWTVEPSGTTDDLYGVWGTGGANVYVVGAAADNVILHSTGGGVWTTQTAAVATDPLVAVWGASATDIYAASLSGIESSTGNGTWSDASTGVQAYSIWGSSATDVYAVANVTIVHSTGTGTWTAETGCTSLSITRVWGANAAAVYAVGSDGIVCFSTGNGTWTPTTVDTGDAFYGVWGSSASDVYVVGDSGVIVHSTGNGAWAAETSGTTNNLYAVWGDGPNDVYAVGYGGVILHSTGGGVWTVETSPTNEILLGVWGGGGTDVYVVGRSGTILHKS